MSLQKILKVGNSLGITLPAGMVKNLSLKAGDRVSITSNSANAITVDFIDSHQLSLDLKPVRKQAKQIRNSP